MSERVPVPPGLAGLSPDVLSGGLLPALVALVARVESATHRTEAALAEIERQNRMAAENNRQQQMIADRMLHLLRQIERARADDVAQRRRECGIPDHEWPEDAVR